MLLRKDGGGHKVGHLFALLYGLECGTDGDLGLAVAHVAADQAVHDLSAFHVGLDVGDGGKLVLRLLKGKHLLEFLLPNGVSPIGKALGLLPGGVELHQVLRDLLHGATHLFLGLGPFLAAKFVELGELCALGGSIFLNDVQARRRDVKVAAVTIFDLHKVLGNAFAGHLLDAAVNPKAVAFMDHVVADL